MRYLICSRTQLNYALKQMQPFLHTTMSAIFKLAFKHEFYLLQNKAHTKCFRKHFHSLWIGWFFPLPSQICSNILHFEIKSFSWKWNIVLYFIAAIKKKKTKHCRLIMLVHVQMSKMKEIKYILMRNFYLFFLSIFFKWSIKSTKM